MIWSISCAGLDPDVPVMPVGVGSNLIVRDGGVPGVVVRLGKPSPRSGGWRDHVRAAAGRAGSSFPRPRASGHRRTRVPARHPGYRRRLRADERRRLWPRGAATSWSKAGSCCAPAGRRMAARAARLHLSSQRGARGRGGGRSAVPGQPGDPDAIGAEMDRIAARARGIAAAAQPHRGLDLQEPGGPQGLAADRRGRLPRPRDRRRASLGKALQLPAQPR